MFIPLYITGRYISSPKRLKGMRKRRRNRLPRIALYTLVFPVAVNPAIPISCGPSLMEIVRAMEPTVRTHPQFQEKLASIKTVVIIPPSGAAAP